MGEFMADSTAKLTSAVRYGGTFLLCSKKAAFSSVAFGSVKRWKYFHPEYLQEFASVHIIYIILSRFAFLILLTQIALHFLAR